MCLIYFLIKWEYSTTVEGEGGEGPFHGWDPKLCKEEGELRKLKNENSETNQKDKILINKLANRWNRKYTQ